MKTKAKSALVVQIKTKRIKSTLWYNGHQKSLFIVVDEKDGENYRVLYTGWYLGGCCGVSLSKDITGFFVKKNDANLIGKVTL